MAPWTNKTGFAKAAAILATITLVSLGLCGVNFVIVISSNSLSWVTSTLFIAGWVELAGILLGAAGLIVVAIIAVARGMMGVKPDRAAIETRDDQGTEN